MQLMAETAELCIEYLRDGRNANAPVVYVVPNPIAGAANLIGSSVSAVKWTDDSLSYCDFIDFIKLRKEFWCMINIFSF